MNLAFLALVSKSGDEDKGSSAEENGGGFRADANGTCVPLVASAAEVVTVGVASVAAPEHFPGANID